MKFIILRIFIGFIIQREQNCSQMPENLSLDHLVSPWDIKLQTTCDLYRKTHKKDHTLIFKKHPTAKLPRPKIKLNDEKKRNYLLVVIDSPNKECGVHTSPTEKRNQQSQSMLRRLKQRLQTVAGQQKSQVMDRLEIPQNDKIKTNTHSKCSKKTTSRESNQSPGLLIQLRSRIKRNVTKNASNHSQIFAKRQQHSPKSIQRFKSNKKLVLPRIQLCTIE